MLRKISRFFRTYLPFARSVLLVRLQYRTGFFFWVFNSLLKVAIVYFLWRAIFRNSPTAVIGGFGFDGMVAYLIVAEATMWMVKCNSEGKIAMEVKNGQIAISLIRPISYTLQNLFNALGKAAFGVMTVGIPLLAGLFVYRALALHLAPPAWTAFAGYVVSLGLSFLVMFLLDITFGLLAFYTTNLWGVMVTKTVITDLLSGSLLPLTFFPDIARRMIELLPFQSIIYSPVMILLGKTEGVDILRTIGVQTVWAVALFGLNRFVWNKAFRRLTILGG
jgi:ABC-2 type transport system permease protein